MESRRYIMAYKIGNRRQITFFPPTIDEYIGSEYPVRVYDAFVDALNIEELGISVRCDNAAGSHEYYPKAMFKLIIYGYSYGNRSSRRLERACHHNLSFIWLMSGLKPDYRKIARFRSENKEAIKNILKQSVKLCIKLGLIEGNTLFIDGSKFRANASIKNTWTDKRCEDYFEKIAKTLKETKKSSINTVDRDCVKAKGRQGTHASYNAQIVVDEKHGLIVSSDAVSENNDLNQFHNQLKEASKVIGDKPKAACSDSGYFSLKDLKQVSEDIMVVMPTQKQAQKENNIHPVKPFDKEQFQYDSTKDEYVCPEGKRLRNIGIAFSDSRKRAYKTDGKDCRVCPHFGVCTPSRDGRRIVRMLEEPLKEHLEAIYHSIREGYAYIC